MNSPEESEPPDEASVSSGDGQLFRVGPEDSGLRLDRFLSDKLEGFSRSKIQNAVKLGLVYLNDVPARSSDALSEGDSVRWEAPAPVPVDCAVAEDIPLDILHEDKWLLVVNKPAGMVVHPGAGNTSGTLVSALLHHCGNLSSVGGADRPGIVHRLDKETSGCIVIAKSDDVHASLSALFETRKISKYYLAAVSGRLRKPSGIVDAPIGRHAVNRQKMAVVSEGRGREAITEYRMLAMQEGVSLVECHPLTGRTHQIRVHLKHLGCPVLGDALYGKRGEFSRHLLHAWKLAFPHPKTGSPLSMEAPLPRDFSSVLPAGLCNSLSAIKMA